MEYADIIKFHGHSCPGLAIGYRMASAAMRQLDISRAGDEEVVAIVENDACGVDALQCVTGCTFGKGNLIFRDYGKSVYTLLSRTSGRAVRVLFHGKGVPDGLRSDRDAYREYLTTCLESDIISTAEIICEAPAAARIRETQLCSECNEIVMETKLLVQDERQTCIPCAERLAKVGLSNQ